MMDNEDTEDYQFLIEMQQLHGQMEVLIERYNMRDRVMSVVVTGLLEPIDEDTSQMKALFSYNLGSKEEMEEMMNFISSTYEDQNGGLDLDDLLGGLDISLN
tara:strand:- start:212 stop:517 length:306 start_codon:yes stop_codon:yes gene_type:complete